MKLYRAHGCQVEISRKGYVKVTRGSGKDYRYWMQHAHKGEQDKFSANILHQSRRRLGYETMPDTEFYAPLD